MTKLMGPEQKALNSEKLCMLSISFDAHVLEICTTCWQNLEHMLRIWSRRTLNGDGVKGDGVEIVKNVFVLKQMCSF